MNGDFQDRGTAANETRKRRSFNLENGDFCDLHLAQMDILHLAQMEDSKTAILAIEKRRFFGLANGGYPQQVALAKRNEAKLSKACPKGRRLAG